MRLAAHTLKGSAIASTASAQTFVLPPFPYIAKVADILKDTRVKVGAQNMHWQEQGAWTGEISALMVKDCGATMAELGHSERRTFFNETDETVALKVKTALKHGLLALVCIGDTKAEYDASPTSVGFSLAAPRGMLRASSASSKPSLQTWERHHENRIGRRQRWKATDRCDRGPSQIKGGP